MTGHALLPLAAVLAAGVTLVSAPPAFADRTGPDEGFTVQGRPVDGQPSLEGAPSLRAGQYVDTVPAGGAEKYYLVSREHRGSPIHVGASVRPAGASSSDSALVVRLLTLGNARCGYVETYNNDHQVRRRNSVLSGATVSWTGDEVLRARCLNEDELVLRVSSTGNTRGLEGRPFELTITEEPPLAAGVKGLPGPVSEPRDWEGKPLLPTTGTSDAPGGRSFNTATELRPGSYRSDIAPGEALFFRVPLHWGQHLQAYVEISDLTAELRRNLDELEQTMTLRLFGPSRGMAGVLSNTAPASVGDVITFDRTIRMATMSLPVRYRNREGENEAQRATSLAGDYYLMVSLAADSQGTRYRVPFELRVNVLGERSGAPSYAKGRKVTGPGASPLAMTGEDLPPAREPEESSARLVTFLATLGLALLLFGAITLTTTRVREVTGRELADSEPEPSSARRDAGI